MSAGKAGQLLLTCLAAFTLPSPLFSDWPSGMHDIQRTCVTREKLSLPLVKAWRAANQPPAPAWPESPAKHDYAHKYYDLKPRQAFDSCYHVSVADNRVYFGSSASCTVTCLDNADGGKERWTFFTEAPVRFAPQVAAGKVFFGSDDGHAYCLDAEDGALIWRERAGPSDAMIWGNQRMISVWPVRTSVLVKNDAVYWAAGLFPEEGMYICMRNASDGKGGWTVPAEMPPQGYLLAAKHRLFVPTGKTQPMIHALKDGAFAGTVGAKGTREGGAWALIAPDNGDFWFGPGIKGIHQHKTQDNVVKIATVDDANTLVVAGEHVYYSTNDALVKINRADRQARWRKKMPGILGLIVAGDHLIAGYDGEVAVLSADGRESWRAKVDGKAFGLAVSDGSLFVSTSAGSIYSFRESPEQDSVQMRQGKSGSIGLDVNSQRVLTVPPLSPGRPEADRRVKVTPPEYAGTEVFHTLYLPPHWTPSGKRLPIIFEYTGNYYPAAGSTGEPEDAALGYGLSGGQYIWVSLPYVSADHKDNAITWWGDEKATVAYAKQNVPRIITQFNADPGAVFLCGFSRGAIAANYIGLHDDEIARLWTAFIAHDHYDGVRAWRKPWGAPLAKYRQGAAERLKRVGGRPYLVSQNWKEQDTENYIRSVLPDVSSFTFLYTNTAEILGKFPNSVARHGHNDRWLLKPSRYRKTTWAWMNAVLKNRAANRR